MESAPETDIRAGFPRSTRSPRGEARRRQLLASVAEDLRVNGLADFSLRRAARAAGTTHKVLLYHFDGAEDLLGQAVAVLRETRIAEAMAMAASGRSLAERVRAVWSALMDDSTGVRAIDQAIGLAMYDPTRYAHLAKDATALYLDPLMGLCPPEWDFDRKEEVAELILATMRGFLMEWQTARNSARIELALAALVRALDREEADGRSRLAT